MKLFFKESSAAEICTACASMNRTGKSNAKKGPEKDYNAYRDFTDRETEAHIIARWLKFVGMTNYSINTEIVCESTCTCTALKC